MRWRIREWISPDASGYRARQEICGIRLKDGDRTITDENDAGVVKSHPLQITEELLEYIKTFDVVHSSCFSHIEDQLVKIRETGVPLLYDFSDVWEERTWQRCART